MGKGIVFCSILPGLEFIKGTVSGGVWGGCQNLFEVEAEPENQFLK